MKETNGLIRSSKKAKLPQGNLAFKGKSLKRLK